jgi:hypothetical protein
VHLVSFFTTHWLIGVIAVILVVFIIGALIKAAIKFAIIAAIIGFILIGVIGLSPNEILHKGKAAVDGVTNIYNNTIDPILTDEIDKADYQVKPNGDYTVTTKDVKITGNKNDDEITIFYNGKSYHINTESLSKPIQEKIKSITSDQS